MERSVRSYQRRCKTSPEIVWSLYAEPRRWKEWAPHVRSPSGLGDPVVRAGAKGSIRLGGAIAVPVRIVSVEPGRSWSWQVGTVLMHHGVRAAGAGSVIEIGLEASPTSDTEAGISPVTAATGVVVAGYMPAVRLLIANLARVAERQTGR